MDAPYKKLYKNLSLEEIAKKICEVNNNKKDAENDFEYLGLPRNEIRENALKIYDY